MIIVTGASDGLGYEIANRRTGIGWMSSSLFFT